MIYLLLPAYNEETSVGKLIESVITLKNSSGLSISIMAVDDGSTDNTNKIYHLYFFRLKTLKSLIRFNIKLICESLKYLSRENICLGLKKKLLKALPGAFLKS